ncbi:MAG: ABC transporter ATP-binding protein [Flavobacteriales bacterium]|nr:ABC transporter ATP-binding protein [Flavobacteriales bacterium]
MGKEKYITLKEVSVGYDGQSVLKDISFELYSGELICLLGANGKGKSTLLKTLMGILPDLSGEILLKGKALANFSAEEKAKEMAVVLTDSLRDVAMKAKDVVATGRYPYLSWKGKLKQEDEAIIETSLSKVGALEYADRWMSDLSDGERQRVILARALAQQTDVLLLDEPTAFLDLAHTMELSVLLKKFSREEGKSIIMSTHDWATALQIADRVFWIDKSSQFHILETEALKKGGKMNEMLNSPFGKWNSDKGRFELLIDN